MTGRRGKTILKINKKKISKKERIGNEISYPFFVFRRGKIKTNSTHPKLTKEEQKEVLQDVTAEMAGLSVREQKFLLATARGISQRKAAQLAGYSPNYSASTLAQRLMPRFQSILTRIGVTPTKLAKVLGEGLAATQVSDAGEHPDYNARHRYLETGLKVFDAFPSQKVRLDHNITYEPYEHKIRRLRERRTQENNKENSPVIDIGNDKNTSDKV